ncbi:hypothetical protein AYM40_30395 [Paraburkholderia phytofirmans OLGA172]|uniref:Uncharacterized protein n=1 Tax=Paraburkholderia phytofirmans OLGA172 TaxID=1417228 RepID=A0A160FUE8_9BURK|nr:hypothetical protein [Paraburkholderia phytofirmans]ANB76516.1 hypothetical protein AYM40_30395 [Paraburkholderia phytofirmans OLGA172]
MIRSGLPNIDSGNPNRHFGKSNNRYGTPALLFDFNRNACSSSSENPVRLQPKSLFGFAEISSRGGKQVPDIDPGSIGKWQFNHQKPRGVVGRAQSIRVCAANVLVT